MKIKELLEGPYEDGVNDGKRGHRNPRASSIYGPSSDHYEKGYQHGVTLGKKEGEANVRRYEEWLKPFSHLSNEELHDLAEKFRRSPEDRMANGQPYPYNSKFQAIHQVLGQRRHNPNYGLDAKHGVAEAGVDPNAPFDYDAWAKSGKKPRQPGKAVKQLAQQTRDAQKKKQQGVAEDADQVKKVFKDKSGKPVGEIGIDPESSPGNGEWYVHHYATGYSVVGFDSAAEAKRELMYVHKHPDAVEGHPSTKEQGVAESASAGATSSASIASVPNPNYANNANKKPVKSVSALDQNSVSLFGAPMETMKNKTGKKLAIIKRR